MLQLTLDLKNAVGAHCDRHGPDRIFTSYLSQVFYLRTAPALTVRVPRYPHHRNLTLVRLLAPPAEALDGG